MDTYRKLTPDEVSQLANQLKYVGCVDLTKAVEGAVRFYGEKCKKLVVMINEEYNDETYDMKASDIRAYDADGLEIEFDEEKPRDYKKLDAYYDWKYDFFDSQPSSGQCDDMYEIEIDVENGSIIGVPELYIKE